MSFTLHTIELNSKMPRKDWNHNSIEMYSALGRLFHD